MPSIATTVMEKAERKEASDILEERIIARDVSALAYAGTLYITSCASLDLFIRRFTQLVQIR